MSRQIEDLLQQACNKALDMVPAQTSEAALYCEAESGMVSAGLIYLATQEQRWIYRFGGRDLSDLLYDLWEMWPQQAGGQHWSALGIAISNGNFQAHPIYPDTFNASDSKLTRRANWFLQSVGAQSIDYSQAA